MDPYRKYFNIDPEYFPAVNSEVIKHNPDLWKKFFPHETFIRLVKDTVAALERKHKLNIWVEGAYGTGKSHAVLTLKHLLDATDQEVTQYFNKFEIDKDLLNRFIAAKNGGKIITVHRYGSSTIHSDNDLVLAMQESIEDALREAGIENAGPDTMRQGILKYLDDDTNKSIIQSLIEGPYKSLFGNRTIEELIEDLGKYHGEDLHALTDKLEKVAHERQMKIFTLDAKGLNSWIAETIKANGLKQIVFIWDEFSEYFYNNVHRLTGFQEMLELSNTQPFCFIQVTHQSEAIVHDTPKLLDRFIKPLCRIVLPDNMAFQLMGAAMQTSDDPVIKKEWLHDFIPDMKERTPHSCKMISKAAKIDQSVLAKILPIHPYAASLLKYISEGFASNQRSMFDFIKNPNVDEERFGFQWFIDHHSPLDDDPFLSIDMLWGFFYETGKDSLTSQVRRTLDNYAQKSKNLSESEKRILKAILLFQAMSEGVAGGVEAFMPTQNNLSYAFEGTDMDHDAVATAERLVKQRVLYKKTERDGSFQYSVHTDGPDAGEIDKFRDEFEKKPTAELIAEGALHSSMNINTELKGRFRLFYAGSATFDAKLTEAKNKSEDDNRHIYVVMAFAKDTNEGALINKKIKSFYKDNPQSKVVVVDASRTTLGQEEFEKWVDHKATAKYYSGKDNNQAATYHNYATSILKGWSQKIGNGSFVLYTSSVVSGKNVNNMDTLNQEFKDIDRKIYPLAPEVNWNLNDTMWSGQGTPAAVETGITMELKGQFKVPNQSRSIPTNFGKAWGCEEYWKTYPSLPISRIKAEMENLIQSRLNSNGRISISEIYERFTEPPYGFLANNFLSFLLGYLLKEYANGQYTWSDGNVSESLTKTKLSGMIVEIMKRDLNPVGHYRDKYIVTMTEEEKAFLDGTSIAFNITRSLCSNVESTRDRVRLSMKSLRFPLWTLEYALPDIKLDTDTKVIGGLIALYCDLANNSSSTRTETDIAMEIGGIYMKNPHAANDLKRILTNEVCRKGMEVYLNQYRGGELILLSKQIEDQGQYINVVERKYDADAAKWVWKKETTDQRIDEVILEYKIAAETKSLLGVACRSYKDAMTEWSKPLSNVRIPYVMLKNELPQIASLLSLLKEYHDSRLFTEQQKEGFLDIIKSEGKAFNDFYLNQGEVFKKVCAFYLNELSSEEIDKIYTQIPSSFYSDEIAYRNQVEQRVAAYRKQQGLTRLRDLWKEKTGTDTPKDWSIKYQMPILIMVPDKDTDKWQKIFDLLNSNLMDEKQISECLTAIENADFLENLKDKDLRDHTFKVRILKDNAIVLDNVDEVRQTLVSRISANPYSWLSSPYLDKTLAEMVRDKYLKGRYTLAMDKIDNMPPEDVKKYLKVLIKTNPTVGIQIIKDK